MTSAILFNKPPTSILNISFLNLSEQLITKFPLSLDATEEEQAGLKIGERHEVVGETFGDDVLDDDERMDIDEQPATHLVVMNSMKLAFNRFFDKFMRGREMTVRVMTIS